MDNVGAQRPIIVHTSDLPYRVRQASKMQCFTGEGIFCEFDLTCRIASNQVGKSNLFLSGVCDGPRLGMLVPRGKRGAGARWSRPEPKSQHQGKLLDCYQSVSKS